MTHPANPPGGEDGHKIKCVYCDGFGVHQNLSRFDPCPDECRWCSGNGYQWQYPGGAIAAYYGGPLMGRAAILRATARTGD